MKRLGKIISLFSLVSVLILPLFTSSISVRADALPRADMVDVSNNNGYMSEEEFRDMKDTYGVKAITVKLTEGTFFVDPYAKSNVENAKAAGLAVNGYAFRRAYTTDQAKSEADLAVKVAKQSGLDSSSVIVYDVELS